MPWTRFGVVFLPDGTDWWARSHAALPVPVQIGPETFRVFISTRDADKRSHVGWVDIDLSGPPRVIGHATEPSLAPGEDGAFDDSGIGIGCVTQTDDRVRLYYMGWNLGMRGKWRNAIGLAQARSCLDRFERYSPGPIVDRSPEDPYSLSYPWVLRRGPKDWWMWYGSNVNADVSGPNMRHVLKMARSRDGIRWERDGATVLGGATPDEYALARPTVTKIGEPFLMCFACRGDHYRIGAAVSTDGMNWKRIDAAMGLDVSSAAWENQMTCYPALFWHRKQLWLAYNGNGYGATGVGLASWQGDYPI